MPQQTTAPRVLVSDALSETAVQIFRDRGIEVDYMPDLGKDKEKLLEAIPQYDGLAIRSATKVTEKLLEKATKLKVIGRAGIGVDNVDIPAASKKGVIVMNTPFGNSVTTAEHAIALMFAVARQLPEASVSTHAGKWEKNRFMGVEVTGKTLGLIGATTLLPHVALRSLADEVGPTHLLATVLLVATLAVTARASHVLVPGTSPALPRILVALSVLVTGGAVVLLGALVGQLVDDARGGYTAGQAGATVVWMATAAVLLLRGLRGSTIAVPAGLGLAALSVGKLLLFDLSFLSGLARVLCFIVAGLILLGMGAGYAQALERSRRGGGGPGTGPTPPVDNPAVPVPVPPTV